MSSAMNKIRALELYSGIGGFHYATQGLSCVIEVVGAVDINPVANQTYAHNFPGVKVLQRNIESLKAEEIDELRIDMLWMSPPCQPFTRLGKQLGSDDKRTESFLQLIQQIPSLKRRPAFILMENVKGFECSHSRHCLTETLARNGYFFQEFLLSPSQLGVPNSRLRYFLVAKLKPFPFATTPDVMLSLPLSVDVQPRPLRGYLETTADLGDYLLSDKVLLRFVNLLDVVEETSTHSCCFTKGYTHMVEGTGSVLKGNHQLSTGEMCEAAALLDDQEDRLRLLRSLQLRYFTSREVANIMGFPKHFDFPSHVTLAQRYRLLGNSLSVSVLNQLLRVCVDGT